MSNIVYNEIEYNQQLFLFELDANGNQIKDRSMLSNTHIISTILTHDMHDKIPTLTVEYEDVGNAYFDNIYATGYTGISFILETGDESAVNISHTFIIDNIEIIHQGEASTKYRIHAISVLKHMLKAIIPLSYQKDTPVFDMISDILEQVKYPLDSNISHDDTSATSTFITPVNTTVLESVNSLLNKAASSSDGLYQLIYSLTKSTGRVHSISKIFKDANVEEYNIMFINNDASACPPESTIFDFTAGNFYGGTNTYDTAGIKKVHRFDYNKREWNIEERNYNQLVSYLPTHSNDQTEVKLFKDIPAKLKDTSLFEHEYITSYNSLSSAKMYNIFRYTDVIQFSVKGLMERDVGQLISVINSLDGSYQRYQGVWLITRIFHEFIDGTYVNNIIAVRAGYKR
jgi:hypothetical protein